MSATLGQDDVTLGPGTYTVPPPVLHPDSAALRFWVPLPAGPPIGASVPWRVLYYRFNGQMDGSNALAIYESHRGEFEAAVLRRVAAGSIEPVMLRENDVPQQVR